MELEVTMAIEIGSQVEVATGTNGFAVVEVTAVEGNEFVGDRVYTPGDVRFSEDDVNEVFEF